MAHAPSVNSGDRHLPSEVEVLIVGAGFGGIAAGVELGKVGVDSFAILEQADGIGGTWWHNSYPGCEVDIASHLYSYSFAPHDWSRTHAQQPELHRYIADVVERHGLSDRIYLKCRVDGADWDELHHGYVVHLSDGRKVRTRVLISAIGLFSQPLIPGWTGLKDFKGPVFHTAQWDHSVDLTDLRVAVVGTGSSASQVVPAIAPLVSRLYLYQREPGWVIPKGDRDFTPDERLRYRRYLAFKRRRYSMFLGFERTKDNIFPGSKFNALAQAGCEAYIAAVFADRPDLRKALTPSYPFFGKRPIFNSLYYPALLRPNVELVPEAVASVTSGAVVDATGAHREVDAIILATGFTPSDFLGAIQVRGRDGRTIQENWNGEPTAFLGMMVAGFPNFYMLYGPNTNSTPSAVFFLECGAKYAVRNVVSMRRSRVAAVEVDQEFVTLYNDWIQRRLRRTVFQNTRNYYKVGSGRIVTQFPYGGAVYWLLTRTLRGVSAVREPRSNATLASLEKRAGRRYRLLVFTAVRLVAEALNAAMGILPPVAPRDTAGYDAFGVEPSTGSHRIESSLGTSRPIEEVS